MKKCRWRVIDSLQACVIVKRVVLIHITRYWYLPLPFFLLQLVPCIYHSIQLFYTAGITTQSKDKSIINAVLHKHFLAPLQEYLINGCFSVLSLPLVNFHFTAFSFILHILFVLASQVTLLIFFFILFVQCNNIGFKLCFLLLVSIYILHHI